MMLTPKIAGALALFAFTITSAHAANLAPANEPTLISDPVLSGFYAEIFGGVSLPGTLNFVGGTQFDLNTGYTFGSAIGWETGLGGLSLEPDALQSRHQLAVQSNVFFGTTTIMANAKYTFHLTEASMWAQAWAPTRSTASTSQVPFGRFGVPDISSWLAAT
jgi:hypothetical protein